MNWLDIVLLLVIVAFGAWEAFRGFGKGVFDALLLYAALWGAGALSPTAAAHLRVHEGAAINHSWIYFGLFLIFGGIALGVSRFVHGMTLINTGIFENLLGLVSGVVAGMVIAHAISGAIVMADPSGKAGAALVSDGFLAGESYSFHTYHSVMDTLTGAGTYRRSMPNVAGN